MNDSHSSGDARQRADVITAAKLAADYARAGLPIVCWLLYPDATGTALDGQVIPPADPADMPRVTRQVVGAYAAHLGVEPRDDRMPGTLHVAACVNDVDVTVWGRVRPRDEDGDE